MLCLLKNESNLKEPSYYHHHFEYHHDSVELSLMPIQMRLAWIGPTTILVTTIIANIFQMSTPFCTPKFFCIIYSLDVKWGKSSWFTNSIFFYLIFTEIAFSFIMSSWIPSCWRANSCKLMSGLHEKFIDRFISGVIHMLSTLIFCQASYVSLLDFVTKIWTPQLPRLKLNQTSTLFAPSSLELDKGERMVVVLARVRKRRSNNGRNLS